jgi:hypothetical protein
LPPLCRVSRATKKKTQLGYKTQRTSLQSFRKFKSTAPRVYAPPGSNRSFAARSRDVPALGVSDLAAGKSSAQHRLRSLRREREGRVEGRRRSSQGVGRVNHFKAHGQARRKSHRTQAASLSYLLELPAGKGPDALSIAPRPWREPRPGIAECRAAGSGQRARTVWGLQGERKLGWRASASGRLGRVWLGGIFRGRCRCRVRV